ncbi:CHAT domain-containing protein [Ilumatobacter sp.]|uniref:CHAT domain-containing protein n=1 Tax=Ilumatobacter sp. TaxID=1967498 RepID=UPI003B524094
MVTNVDELPRDDAEVLVLANSDPRRVLDAAAADPGAPSVTGWRAVAIAHRVLGHLDEALAATATGVERALASDDRRGAALCRLTAAPMLAQLGEVAGAFAALDDAEQVLHGVDRAEVHFQRGGVLGLVADYRPARREYTMALAAFRRAGLVAWTADTLMNRGLMSAYLGATRAARSDLATAAELFDAEGDRIGAGAAIHNLALAALIAGEPLRALADFERADERLSAAGFPVELFHADLCAALLAVGLRGDAIDVATAGVAALEAAGNDLEAATQRLVLATALAHGGDVERARSHVEAARTAFVAQGQGHRARRAELARWSIELASGADPAEVGDRVEELCGRFALTGHEEWHGAALLVAVDAALARGDLEAAAAALGRHRRTSPPFTQLVRRCALQAEVVRRRGRPGEALRAARRGLRLVERERDRATTMELHDSLSDHLVALGRIGVGCLVASQRHRDALVFAERIARVREEAVDASAEVGGAPSASATLVEHRAVTRAIEEAENERRDPTPLVRRRRELRRAVRAERARRDRGRRGTTGSIVALPGTATVRRFAVDGSSLWALDLVGGRVSGRPLGDLDEIEAACRELTFRARRALFGRTGDAALHGVAAEVDELLGHPGELGGDDGVVHLVVDSAIPMIPFSMLPSLRSTAWAHSVQASARPGPDRSGASGSVVLVAGPDLDSAEREIDALASLHPRARVLTGPDATCGAVLAALDGAELVHVAAHSSLNTDNPMFSSLSLADGALTVHEMGHLVRPASTVVLASCESATSVAVGTSSIGLTNSLLRFGIGSVVGSACEIPDSEATAGVHRRLHERDLQDLPRALRDVRTDPSLGHDEGLVARVLIPATLAPRG